MAFKLSSLFSDIIIPFHVLCKNHTTFCFHFPLLSFWMLMSYIYWYMCYKAHNNTVITFCSPGNYLLKKFKSRKNIFKICPSAYHFWCFSILFLDLGFMYIFFLLSENFLLHFLWFRPAGNEFIQLLFVWKSFISPSFLKDIFVDCRILK